MLQAQTSKRWLRQWDDLPEIVAWLKTEPKVWSQRSSQNNGGNPPSRSWDLNSGYEGALKLAETGWEEGVRSLFALAATVPNNAVVTKEYSIAGDFADVPRYLAGDPFNMVKRGKQRAPKPSMTIALNTRISCAVKAQEAANFGAAIVALVDRLESRNVRVELIGLLATDVTNLRLCASWTVKRLEDALDLSAVAFSYAHPAMFRRLGFAIMERMPRSSECYGYGFEGGISRDDFIDLPEGALLIDGVNHNPGACKTMEGALKFAKRQINEAAGSDIVELEELDV